MSKHICISGWATWIMVLLPCICQLPSAGSIGSDICVKIRWQGRGREGWRGWKGGKRLQPVPKCSDCDPQRPAHASLTTAGGWDYTHSLAWPWNKAERDGMSLLMTDKMEKCDELVRLSVRHGLGCVKAKGKQFKHLYYYTGATEYLHFIARHKINDAYNEYYMFEPETMW